MINLTKSCVMCDSEFTPRLAGRVQIYCSKTCKRNYEKEVRKLGLQAVKLKSPILKAGVKKKNGEEC